MNNGKIKFITYKKKERERENIKLYISLIIDIASLESKMRNLVRIFVNTLFL